MAAQLDVVRRKALAAAPVDQREAAAGDLEALEVSSKLYFAGLIVEAVSGLGEKEISAVMERPGGLGRLLVYVDTIEIYKDEEAESKKNSLAAAVENQLDRTLFTSWFNQRRLESGSQRADAPTNLQ